MSNTTLKQVSAIALLVLGSCGIAQAGVMSAINNGTADIIFGGSGTASITITPVSGLLAGPAIAQTKVADGQVTSTGTGNNSAYRWNTSTGTITSSATGKGQDTVLVHGANNAANTVTFITSSNDSTPSPSDDSWFVSNAQDSTVNFIISTTAAAEDVQVDRYPVSMDAAIWVE